MQETNGPQTHENNSESCESELASRNKIAMVLILALAAIVVLVFFKFFVLILDRVRVEHVNNEINKTMQQIKNESSAQNTEMQSYQKQFDKNMNSTQEMFNIARNNIVAQQNTILNKYQQMQSSQATNKTSSLSDQNNEEIMQKMVTEYNKDTQKMDNAILNSHDEQGK